MNSFSNNVRELKDIKPIKLFFIIFFITAGCLTSLIQPAAEVSNGSDDTAITMCIDSGKLEPLLNQKERNCSYGIEIQVNNNFSQGLSRLYNNLRLTVSKIINT